MSDKIRVVIADDYNVIREGLKALLWEFDDLDVVGEAEDGQHAFDICRTECPDVVLMDIHMPVMDGRTATAKILEACPQAKVIAISSHIDQNHVQDILQAGAISYLSKDVSSKALHDAIKQAHNGESTLSREAAQALVQATTGPPPLGHDLTDRERDVLALMIEGLSNPDIGEKLFISSSTVKNHVSSILGKLEAESRTEAVALALENNILE